MNQDKYHWSSNNRRNDSRYKWVKTNTKTAAPQLSVLSAQRFSGSGKPVLTNTVSQECSKMIERLNKAVGTFTKFANNATVTHQTARQVAQCENCTRMRTKNPYQFVRCQLCKSQYSRSPSRAISEEVKRRMTSRKDSISNQPSVVEGREQQPLRKAFIQTRYKVDRSSNQSSVVDGRDQQLGRKEQQPVRKAFIQTRYKVDRSSNQSSVVDGMDEQLGRKEQQPVRKAFIQTRYKVDRSSNQSSVVDGRDQQLGRKEQQPVRKAFIQTRYKVDRSSNQSSVFDGRDQQLGRKEQQPVRKAFIQTRYKVDRRSEASRRQALKRRQIVNSLRRVQRPMWPRGQATSPKSIMLRRKLLNDQGYIVSKFKMRRKSLGITVSGGHSAVFKGTSKRVSSKYVWRRRSSSTRVQRDEQMTRQLFYRHAIGRAKQVLSRQRAFCFQFIRRGVCRNRSACRLIHDQRTVRLCPRFLAGHCPTAACPLAHVRDEDRLPLCTFFERGVCSRGADCPFRHIKFPPDTPVCVDFQWSFCSRGAKCPRRHVLGSRSFVKKEVPTLKPEEKAISERRKEESELFLPLLSDSDEEEG